MGAWFVGARGSVATTAVAGAAAVSARLAAPVGLVTTMPPFDRVALPHLGDLVFGGHDLVTTPLVKRAEALAEGGVLPPALLPAVADALDRADREIRLGLATAPIPRAGDPLTSPQPASPPGPDAPGRAGDAGAAFAGRDRAANAAATPQELVERAAAGPDAPDRANGARAPFAGQGPAAGVAGSPREVVEGAAADIEELRGRYGLDTVVVVNLTSTEPFAGDGLAELSAGELGRRLDDPEAAFPPGVLAACAALEAGCPFVDFTPSIATRMPAIAELAAERGVPYAGRDGKTGETLVKTALAPLFAHRNLRVRSWAGTNLLGGSDGAALADPARAASKLRSKRQALTRILGAEPAGPLHIDYVPDLGEWKTAWDHVGFEGFLGVRMTLQVTWQGCDSTLAAPLVLDLVRLMAAAHQAGHAGPQGPLGFFFKDPIDTTEHALERQFQHLCAWTETLPRRGPNGDDGR